MADNVVEYEVNQPQDDGDDFGSQPRQQAVGNGAVVLAAEQVELLRKEQKQTR